MSPKYAVYILVHTRIDATLSGSVLTQGVSFDSMEEAKNYIGKALNESKNNEKFIVIEVYSAASLTLGIP